MMKESTNTGRWIDGTSVGGAAMNWRMAANRPALILLVTMAMAGCESAAPAPYRLTESARSAGPVFVVPQDVLRIAVLYPHSSNSDFSEAYRRLEGAAFELKRRRMGLKIIDRFDLPVLLSEQQLQARGAVGDDGAVRIGRILGVDSVLLYSIEGPTLRDRFMADRPGQLRPITVTTKIIRVESAEIVFHNVVTARMDEGERRGWSFMDGTDVREVSRDALERGIRQTVFDLQQAFE